MTWLAYNFDDHPQSQKTVEDIVHAWGVEPLDVETHVEKLLRIQVQCVGATETHFQYWMQKCRELISSIGDADRRYSPLSAAQAIVESIRSFRP